MENWEQVGKAARIAADSQGNAAQKMEAYTDSVQAAKNRITAAVEKLTQNAHLQGLLKDFYKVTAGMIDNIGKISLAIAGYLTLFKGKSLFTGLFGEGKFLNNAMYKMMDIGAGANKQGSLFGQIRNQYGNGQFKNMVNEMALINGQERAERNFFNKSNPLAFRDDQSRTMARNFLSLGGEAGSGLGAKAAGPEGKVNSAYNKQIKASISKYVLGLDAAGNAVQMSNEMREAEMKGLQRLLTTEEKYQLTTEMLSEEQMKSAEVRAQAKMQDQLAKMSEEQRTKLTNEEKLVMQQKIQAEEQLKIAMDEYARTMKNASSAQKAGANKYIMYGTDPNQGMKDLKAGAISTTFTTAGALAPMMFSKGAGALGEKVGLDDSTSMFMSMFGMSAIGNLAAKNSKGILEGAAAFSKAAKSARLASNTLNASGGLIGGLNLMGSSAKAGTAALLGVEGAMAGIATAGLLVVGIVAMMVAQAREKAKEARMEAYKESKAKYDSLIDATATFNDSKYTHLAAGVDEHGNNVSLTDDEYQEFVDMSNKLAEAFPELVTYTDEVGNHFLSLGEDAQNLGTKLEEATAAAQRVRDRDLLATREDVSKDYEKDLAEKSDDTKMLQNVSKFISGEVGGHAGKAEKEFIEKYSNLTVKGGKLVNKDTGEAATNAEIEHLQQSTNVALSDNTAAIKNLTATYSDFGVAQLRMLMGLNEDGTSVYDNLPDDVRQTMQNMVSYIPPNAANYEEVISGIARFAQNFDWSTYNTNMNNKAASAESLHDYRKALSDDMISQWGQNALQWSADQKAIAMQLDFEIDENGNLQDTKDTLQEIYDLAESKGISSDIVDSWGVNDKSVKNAQSLYQYLNEGKISAEATADEVWGLVDANSDDKNALNARTGALKNVTEDNFTDYVDQLLENGETATLENVTKYFGGVGEETANVIAQEANNMIEASKATSDEHWKNMSDEEKQEMKNTAADQVVADAQAVADAAQKEADAKAETAKHTPSGSAEKQAAKAAQDKAKAAQKEADATREKAEAYKKEGVTSDRDFGGKVQKKLDENNSKAALDRSKEEQKAKDDNKKNKKKYQKKAIDDTVKEYEKDAQRKQEKADSKQTTSEKKDKRAAKLAEEAKEAEEAYKDLNTQAKKAEKTNAKNAAELKTSAKAAKTIANNKKKEASSAAKTAKSAKTEATNAKKTAKAAKDKANAAKKESKALKGNVDKGKGLNGDSDLAKDSAKAWEKANKKRVKDAKSTAKKLVKEDKSAFKNIKKAADSASLEGPIKEAQAAYQQFFSSIQDEDNNGFINTWNEMRQEFELINEEITRTSNALDEQKEYGKLSAQTVLELLSADEDYINVLEVKNGQIQLAANAEEKMAQIKLQAAREQIEADIEELEAKKSTIEGILAAGKATDAELESIGAKVEGQNEEINATNASVTASYSAANAALKAAAGYDTAGNAAAAAATKIAAYNQATQNKATHVKAGSTSTKTQTVSSGSYGSAPTTKKANFKINKSHKLSADEIKNLEEQLGKIDKEIDTKNALKDGLKDVKGFKEMYTPGGGKSGGSGGGGGGGGDDYTKLDHVKDILSAINKEYQQMVTYNKALGAGHDIEISYYQKKKKYLEEEIKLLKTKMAKDAKKSNKSDYYQDIQDYQQAKIDLANLDDEKIQDQLDLLDARKELTGIAYKYEVSLYKKLLKTADTEQERLEYEKKLIDAQKEQIDNQREIASAMKDTLDLEKSLALAYKGISQGYKKNANGYSYTSDLAGLSDITIKGTDGHTASGVANSINKKREAAVEKAKKKYKYVKVGVDRTGTLQYSYSNKNAATAEKKLASKLTTEDSKMGSDGIDFNEAYVTDSFGNKHWYIKSKANTKTAQLIKKYKKNGYYVAVDVDDTGRLHFSKHKKTKKYTKKKAKKKLNASVKTFVDAANVTAEHQDNGGSQQEYNSNVKKTTYEKLVDKDVKKVLSQKAESLGVIDTINKSIDDQIELIKDDMEGILRKRAAVTKGSKEDLELVQEYQEALDSILELEKERVQTRIDMLDAAGINNELLLNEYKELMKTSKTTAEEWENQKKLNDALKEYNSLLRDTLEYKYALYDNILEYESYTPSKDTNSQYMKAISAQKDILEEELKMAKENAEAYRKMAFDANVKAYMEYGYSEQEAKDKAWKDSENDSDYQEAVNQYVEAFQKMGELVLRQFNDIADAIGRKLDKLEQQRAEEWRSTWNGTWDNEGKLITKAQDKIKAYYDSIQAMQNQIKAEALATLKDVTYLTDEQVQELVDKYNEAAVEVHQAMIDQMQDTVDYQDALYNAVVDEVNDIIFNLEKQKELTEEMYDDEIESLQKKEDSITRSNELLEKQKALQDALNDRQRVYRSGKIMPMTNYIG